MGAKFNLRKGDKVWVSGVSEKSARAFPQITEEFRRMDGNDYLCGNWRGSVHQRRYAVPAEDKDGWIKWNADEADFRPVWKGTPVEVVLEGGGILRRDADDFNWSANDPYPIIKYRVRPQAEKEATLNEVNAINHAMDGAVSLLHSHIKNLKGQLADKTAQWVHQRSSSHKARKRLWEVESASEHPNASITELLGCNQSLASENERLKEEIRALEEELGNTPEAAIEFYTIGAHFMIEFAAMAEEEYVLTQSPSASGNFALICIEDGMHLTHPAITPESTDIITIEEIKAHVPTITNIYPVEKTNE